MADRIAQATEKLDEAHAQLSRVSGTTGTIIVEHKLEAIIDAVRLLADEVRELRDGSKPRSGQRVY